MTEKFDRSALIKKALDSQGFDIYAALYSQILSGNSCYLTTITDNVIEALVNEMKYASRSFVPIYEHYFDDIAAELSKRGFGDGNIRIRKALYGGHELHMKLKYYNWIINVEYGDIYALRWGKKTEGFWNLVSVKYTNSGLMVIHPADLADLLVRLDSFYPDIRKIISAKHNMLQRRILRQKLDKTMIIAALHEAGIKRYKLFSVSSVTLCLQVSLNASGKKAQIMIPSREANTIIPKLETGLTALIEEQRNELNAYIYYD